MMVPKIFSAIATAVILFATSSNVSAESETINFVDGVDWRNRVVTVTGEGLAPNIVVNKLMAKNMAAKAARADAYRKLAEIVNGVRVEGETTVEKMLKTYSQVKLKVAATIRGAVVVNETFLPEGVCRVVMQMPLFGTSNSLAGAVFEQFSNVEPFPDPVLEVEPSSLPYNSYTPVKQRIEITSKSNVEQKDIMSVPATAYGSLTAKMAFPTSQIAGDKPNFQPVRRRSVTEYASLAQGDYTGLIVDCRGLGLQPVMSPVIKNSNGTKIYGHKNLDIDKIIEMGMADYIGDSENVDRAGSNPLVVKAISLENFNSNPVLTIPDSNRVLIENYATKFLKDLKVVFLCDN